MTFTEIVNDMLVTVYHKILQFEEEFLQSGIGAGISIRDMHMIEYIGKAGAEGRTLSEIADFLDVARPSVTVSARKLEQKGFLAKGDCNQDGRVVRVTLTRQGRRVFMHHLRFHTIMVNELESELSQEEKDVLLSVITKLDKFFGKRIEATT